MRRPLNRELCAGCALAVAVVLSSSAAPAQQPPGADEAARARKYLAANASGYSQEDQVIVFDTATNRFVGALPPTLKTSERLWVVLANVDTLRFSYGLQGKQITYQPSQPPSVLGPIALGAQEKQDDLPTAFRVQRAARAAVSVEKQQDTSPGRDPYKTVRDAAIAFVRESDVTLASVERTLDTCASLRRLAEARSWNEDRRSSACKILEGSGPLKDCPSAVAGFVASTAARARELDAKYRAFVSAALEWTLSHKEPGLEKEDLGDAVDAQYERVSKVLTSRAPELNDAAQLLALIMDGGPAGRTPPYLVRQYPRLSFDEIQISVGAQALTMTSTGLPSTSQPSSSPGASDFVTQTARIPVVGCCRIGFSLGLVGTSLVTHHYYLTPAASSSSKPLVSEGPTDTVDLSPAALMHFDWSWRPEWSTGVAVGLTTSSPIRTLFGAGLSMGRRLRGTLTAGLAVGSVTELNGDVVGAPPISSSGVSTTSVTKTGWFLGLSGSFVLP